MLDDLMGNMQNKQDAMKKELATIEILHENQGIKIKANGAREILNIEIDPSLLEDKEQLEDLLIVTINDLLDKVAEKEAAVSQKMINEMLPPGLGGLFGGQ